MGISEKVNEIAQMKFELAYSDLTLQHINPYVIVIP